MFSPGLRQLRIVHVLYSLLILALAFIYIDPAKAPIDDTFVLTLRLDYLIHFTLFVPWMGLVWLAYQVNFRNTTKALRWILIGIAFSWFSEGMQYFIPYRSFNLNDIVANTSGILFGSFFFIFPRSGAVPAPPENDN